MMYHADYLHYPDPKSTVDDVENCIANNTHDEDNISYVDWLKMLSTDDLLQNLLQYILSNKNDPMIKPMRQMLRIEIGGILDKED